MGVLPYAGSGLVAPPWGVALLWLLWAALLGLAVVLFRRGSWLVLLPAPAALALWALVVTLGDVLLGWTA